MGMLKVLVGGVRHGVKYGPVVAAAAKEARGPMTEYARSAVEGTRQRRLAIAEAATLKDGTVLAVIRGERPVWVVFSGSVPVSSHPDLGVPPADLVEHANLDLRRSPAEFPTVRKRVAAAGRKAAVVVPRRHRDDTPTDTGTSS